MLKVFYPRYAGAKYDLVQRENFFDIVFYCSLLHSLGTEFSQGVSVVSYLSQMIHSSEVLHCNPNHTGIVLITADRLASVLFI